MAVDKIALQMSLENGESLEANKPAALQELIESSHRFDVNFVESDLARRVTGGTGLVEPYGAGEFKSAQDMAKAIAQIGAEILTNAKESAIGANKPDFMSRLWKFIDKGAYDHEIASFLNDILGGLLARLKAAKGGDNGVARVKEIIRDAAKSTQPIEYHLGENGGVIEKQTYSLPELGTLQNVLAELLPIKEAVNFQLFSDDERWGYTLMLWLGSVGHPTNRRALQILSA